MSERTANQYLESAAAERARWAAVLAAPTRAPRRPRGIFARIVSIFA